MTDWRTVWGETAETVGDRTNARWLCETASGAHGDEFLFVLEDTPTERMIAHLDAMLERLAAGEPLQYVLGHWAFRHLDLLVDRRVLIPRPETESVAETAIALAADAGPLRRVADLGTGSGAIGLALADELPVDGTVVWLTDVSDEALAVAGSNIAGLGPSARNVRLATGSWFEALPDDELFDVVVANPPYVADRTPDIEPIVADWEPAGALFAGPEGLDEIVRIVDGAPGALRPGGWLVLEIGADQGPAVAALLADAGFDEVEIRPDLAGHDRIAIGRRPVALFADDGLSVRHLINRIDDYALLLRWLRTPEVLEWYGGRDEEYDLARVLGEYGPGGTKEREATIPAIIELEGRPVGYLQLYELGPWADEFGIEDGDDVWSIDLYVGEPELHGTGLGRRVVRAAADHLLGERGAREVLIMPYPENERAVASYRAAGFVEDGIVRHHEMHEGVMRDGLRMIYRPT